MRNGNDRELMKKGRYARQSVLYTSGDMHSAIKYVLSNRLKTERRVVIVAYLGRSAESYLPNPAGLKVVCSLEPGATSAHSIESIRKRGGQVLKSSRLHMKVYWSEKRGCVIGSANASKNALGKNGLKEAGVYLPPGQVDIDRLLRIAQAKAITGADIRLLRKENDRLNASVHSIKTPLDPKITFPDWHMSKGRSKFRLGWWETDDLKASKAASKKSLSMYGRREPDDVINVRHGEAAEGDWILCFNDGALKEFSWLYVDFLVRVPRSEKEAYSQEFPLEAIQVRPSEEYANPPFRIDGKFPRAFREATKAFGIERLKHARLANPPPDWLKRIAKSKAWGPNP